MMDDKSVAGELPLVSIVVAVFNGAATIEALLLSVINNTYKNIDIIVMDGGSTDETINILRQYDQYIKVWRSERDDGIYDALNKGLALCEAESYVLILGADDRLLSLGDVVDAIQVNRADLIVANVQQKNINTGVVSLYECFLPGFIGNSNFLDFPMHHQGFMFKKSDYFKQQFDLRLGLHSDYEFMASAVRACVNPVYVNTALAEYSTGGASDYFSMKNMKSLSAVATSLGLNRMRVACASPVKFLRMILKVFVSRRVIDFLRKVQAARHV
ncbi:hypothetical protein PspS35_08605 [Pseudomonas sp. S35]|uniref:glycosyltransferase n=1 Tax=Pseudomonas sp. S35 TaxID=1573719 RepID=UPI00132EB758|nr:glycosyltransferase [Pseudomonas sp. S35]QHF43859.1 hypothetical protein PspS35_08605 [Pseudomonas sp. S35]